jgi:rod shape-determining protein MreC
VATFGTATSRPLPGRGASPGFRFTLYAALSVGCMFLDQRGGWLERARYALQAAAYPLQLAVNSPSAAWEWVAETFESRSQLKAENEALRKAKRELELRAMRFAALARENAQLRGLKEALPSAVERWLPAEVVSVELNSLKQRLLINRGASNGVVKGQSVLTDDGLLGQTTRVGPWSAEIILVTDPEHAVPVQIERTGLRTIAVGGGATSALVLPYLPANTDIQENDLLLTSGLGGVFPAGYPVARVTEVRRGPGQPFAYVRAAPLARLDADREVMLVWFREGHPAAPPTITAENEITKGSETIQPQPRPAVAQVPAAAPREKAPERRPRNTATAATRMRTTPPAEASINREAPPAPEANEPAPSEPPAPEGEPAAPVTGTETPSAPVAAQDEPTAPEASEGQTQ